MGLGVLSHTLVLHLVLEVFSPLLRQMLQLFLSCFGPARGFRSLRIVSALCEAGLRILQENTPENSSS